MKRLSKAQIEYLEEKYKPGTIVELIHMDDVQAPPEGTRGKVFGVDSLGDILVDWDNGSHLKIIPEVDSCRIISPEEVTA